MTFAADGLRARLTRTADNAALYLALTGAERVRQISEQVGYGTEPGYRLIRVDHRVNALGDDGFEIALVDDVHSSVAYYDKVTLVRIPEAGNRHVARNQVWRSANIRHSSSLRDITQQVLFGYIAQHYDILFEEGEISGGGKFYWHRQVSRAIEGRFQVSIYERAAQAFRPVSSQRALNRIQDQAWLRPDHEPLLALVSNLPLGNR